MHFSCFILDFPLTPCRLLLGLFFVITAGSHECVQQKGLDSAEQRLCSQRPGPAGGGSQHRLLAVPGGGSHYAPEPEHGHQDVAALRSVEGLFSSWLVTRTGSVRSFFSRVTFKDVHYYQLPTVTESDPVTLTYRHCERQL